MAMKKKTTAATTPVAPVEPASGSLTTTDHDTIRAWAEARGGKPAAVGGTGNGDDVGLIRLEFPGATDANDANLAEIPWDEFFQKFDASGLALVYQEQTAGGEQSNFNKLVKREPAAPAPVEVKRPVAKRSAAKKTAKKGTKVAKATAKKTTTAKKAPPVKATAKKAAAKKTATAKKAPAAKKVTAKKTATTAKKATAKKVPASRGFRGR
jgi:hypothetical protein